MTPALDKTCPPRISLRFDVPCREAGCAGCTHAAEDDGTRCGDAVAFRLRVDDQGRIERICHEGEACSVALDTAEALAAHFQGKQAEDVRRSTFEEAVAIYGEPVHRGRRECCRLAWSVLKKAVDHGQR